MWAEAILTLRGVNLETKGLRAFLAQGRLLVSLLWSHAETSVQSQTRFGKDILIWTIAPRPPLPYLRGSNKRPEF